MWKVTIPVVVLMAAAALPDRGGEWCHFLRSAHSFQQYFRALRPAQASLNPVERLVYSLILANTSPEA